MKSVAEVPKKGRSVAELMDIDWDGDLIVPKEEWFATENVQLISHNNFFNEF